MFYRYAEAIEIAFGNKIKSAPYLLLRSFYFLVNVLPHAYRAFVIYLMYGIQPQPSI